MHGEKANTFAVCCKKPEGERPLGKPTIRWRNNIKMNLKY